MLTEKRSRQYWLRTTAKMLAENARDDAKNPEMILAEKRPKPCWLSTPETMLRRC
jgi:hypothetical protein